MWLLERDGTLHEGGIDAAEADGADASFAPGGADEAVAIRFGATQDGRGFSLARRLRLTGHRGRLTAVGPLEPDQARHAFQCGFDVVAVGDATLDRHGRAAWADALAVSVTTPYFSDPTSRPGVPGIWARRSGAA